MISSTCNQYSIKGIFLILLLMISTTFIQAQKADLSFSIHLKKANLKEFIFEIEKPPATLLFMERKSSLNIL